MSKLNRCLPLVLALAMPACAGSYGKPSAMAPATVFSDTSPSDDLLVVDGLVEFGDTFPFRHRPKGTGQLTISNDRIGWSNPEDSERSFSIRPAAVRTVTMQCVTRAGGNVCLELEIATITGLSYHFRDIDWAGGYNQQIRRVHDHLEQSFPRIVFAAETVESIE